MMWMLLLWVVLAVGLGALIQRDLRRAERRRRLAAVPHVRIVGDYAAFDAAMRKATRALNEFGHALEQAIPKDPS